MPRPKLIPAALIVAVVAAFGVTVIHAKSSKPATAMPASVSIGVMQMMIEAKGLPDEQYDAH